MPCAKPVLRSKRRRATPGRTRAAKSVSSMSVINPFAPITLYSCTYNM